MRSDYFSYQIDETKTTTKAPESQSQYEKIEGTFCNCFFKPWESNVFSTRWHETEKEHDGTCVWCGYETVNQIKENYLQVIDLKSVNFLTMDKKHYNNKLLSK